MNCRVFHPFSDSFFKGIENGLASGEKPIISLHILGIRFSCKKRLDFHYKSLSAPEKNEFLTTIHTFNIQIAFVFCNSIPYFRLISEKKCYNDDVLRTVLGVSHEVTYLTILCFYDSSSAFSLRPQGSKEYIPLYDTVRKMQIWTIQQNNSMIWGFYPMLLRRAAFADLWPLLQKSHKSPKMWPPPPLEPPR